MKPFDFLSVRNHFVYDKERSQTVIGNYFFCYLHSSDIKRKKEEKDIQFYVIIEENDITFKSEITNNSNQIQLHNLLVVPKNVEHHSFLEIETQIIRQKVEDKNRKKSKYNLKGTFEQFLYDFIEDLYVHKYFKDCGNTQAIRSALEHIPLIRGIIHKFLFEYHYQECIKIKRKKDWKLPYKRERFEGAYLNYSKFLSQTQNERLFQTGGWFVPTSKERPYKDIDSELYNAEHRFLKIEKKLETDNFLFSESVNIKHILKRYGIADVLKITLPKWMLSTFLCLLILLIGFILGDIIVFNYNSGNLNRQEQLESFFEYGLTIISSLFLIFTLLIAILAFLKHKLKVIPGIFLPRLIIAIVSGWVVFFTAEELLKIDIDISGWLLLALSVFIFTINIIFMVFEINNYAPAMDWRKILKRSLVVTGLAFVVSYTFGFWTMTHVNEKFFSIANPYVDESVFKKVFEEREKYFTTVINKIHETEKKFDESLSKSFDENLSKKNKDYSVNIKELKFIPIDSILSNQDIKKYDSLVKSKVDILNKRIKEQKSNLDNLNNKDIEQIYPAKKGHIIVCHKSKIDSLIFKNFNNSISNKLNEEIGKNPLKSSNHYLLEYLANSQNAKINRQDIYAKTYDFEKMGVCIGIKRHTTFPNMLLARALVAMFIGIFLQLIIQDKTITEPI